MDPRTDELRAAHDVLAEPYAERLTDMIDRMPVERSVLSLFRDLVVESGLGTSVADVGCGTGRLAPHLHELGLSPRGVDLSPEMIRVARRDHPGFTFEVGDLRRLPYANASLAGVVCWYSLMYLPPDERAGAFAELARVVAPGGHLATAFKAGDGQMRRAGRTLGLGIEFDIWWYSPDGMQQLLVDAGFEIVSWAGRPADPDEMQPQGYVVARRGDALPLPRA